MKRILFVLLVLSTGLKAQITYQGTLYADMQGPGNDSRPTVINLGGNEYKYYYYNYNSNQIKLFNLDFTPFATITVPVSIDAYWNVGYITRTLFDCNPDKIEYAVMPWGQFRSFYIFREDGTLLFQKDSTLAMYCLGCYNDSYEVKPIYNTPNGTVLMLLNQDSLGITHSENIYSLCGTLETQTEEIPENMQHYMIAYPNPSTGEINFELDLPSNYGEYELSIYNSALQSVKKIPIKGSTRKYSYNEPLSSGTYFYSISDGQKVIQTGKFILNK